MGSAAVPAVDFGVSPESVIARRMQGRPGHMSTAFPLAPREMIRAGTSATTVGTAVLPSYGSPSSLGPFGECSEEVIEQE